MIRQAFAAKIATLGIALVFARDPGCGGVESTSSGINAPCTRDKDCRDELSCQKGVCTGPDKDDAGIDSSAKDSGIPDVGGGG